MAQCDAVGVNGSNRISLMALRNRGWCRMDVWEVPCSSCSGLDRGFLMDGAMRRRL